MSRLSFFFQYALRSMHRGGQRTVLAIVCIAFGVMSLVALQTVGLVFTTAIAPDTRISIGGDATIYPGSVESKLSPSQFTDDQLARLDQLRQSGAISAYSPEAKQFGLMLRPEGATRVYFLTRAMGIDPKVYPLVGQVKLAGTNGDPGASLAASISRTGNAAITSNLSSNLNLKVGSQFTLAGPAGPVPLRVSAVVESLPDTVGDSVIYNLDTARMVAGLPDVVDSAAVLWGPSGTAEPQLTAAGFAVHTADAANQQQQGRNIVQIFTWLLKGAGILGLFIGGVGVANTIRALLSRRTLEIATLKTHGYRQRDLLVLFGVETALLGLIGSLIGAGAAILLAGRLVSALSNLSRGAATWSLDPAVVVGGILAGIATTVIFGLNAIVRASGVRPIMILRDLPVQRTWRNRLPGLGLYALLAVAFIGVSSLIMQSVLLGAAAVGAAAVGLAVLSVVLGGLFYALLRIPIPDRSLLSLARNYLRRQRTRVIFALVALFVGVYAIGAGATTLMTARDQVLANQIPETGYNVWVYGTPADEAQIRSQLTAQGVQDVHVNYQTPAQLRVANGVTNSMLEGRAPEDAGLGFKLADGVAWDGSPDAAYLPDSMRAPEQGMDVGSTVTVITGAGVQHDFRVVGFYTPVWESALTTPPSGLVVNNATAQQVAGQTAVATYAGQAPKDRLRGVTDALGRALPGAMVASKADAADLLNSQYTSLGFFVLGTAGLAFLAGAVLIANAVGLAMDERKRELGILKAVGFSSGHVLRTVLLENSMLGLIAGVIGMAALFVTVPVLNHIWPKLEMQLYPALVLAMVVAAVLIALAASTLAAWRPTHLRPLEVLRNE